MTKDQYKQSIKELVDKCDDSPLLDLIYRLLLKRFKQR